MWHLATERPPEDTPHWFDDAYRSVPVIGYMPRSATMRLVTCEATDDGDAWYTVDSERWEVTGDVTHWHPLPVSLPPKP